MIVFIVHRNVHVRRGASHPPRLLNCLPALVISPELRRPSLLPTACTFPYEQKTIRTRTVLTFFTTLCEEQDVRTAFRTGAVGLRSAALTAVMLRSLYGEESADYDVAEPLAWGLEEVGKV